MVCMFVEGDGVISLVELISSGKIGGFGVDDGYFFVSMDFRRCGDYLVYFEVMVNNGIFDGFDVDRVFVDI